MNDKIELIDVIRTLTEGRKIVLSVVGIFMILAIMGLLIVTPKFTAAMVLAPSSVSSTGGGGMSQLAGVASLAGISLPEDDELSSFTEFQERLTSFQVAEGLAKNPETLQNIFPEYWNSETGKWNTRPGILATIRYAAGRIFGLPGWSPPDAEDLMHFLADEVTARVDSDLPLFTIEFEHENPDFAQKFIQDLHEATDRLVRRDSLERTSKQVVYLEKKLAQAVLLEHKKALALLILSQEQKMMMLEIDLPYAARVISPARVSTEPTSPRPILVLLISLIAGLLLGVFLLFLLEFLRNIKIEITEKTASAP